MGFTVALFVNSFEMLLTTLLSMPVQRHCGPFQGLEPFRVKSNHILLLPLSLLSPEAPDFSGKSANCAPPHHIGSELKEVYEATMR